MKFIFVNILLIMVFGISARAQPLPAGYTSFFIADSVKVTIDFPGNFKRNKTTIICFYALPNGNTTAQTIGKLMQTGDDWHYDIQHTGAQTSFIRQQLSGKNFVIIYLENSMKSWPAWRRKEGRDPLVFRHIVDTLAGLVPGKKQVYLNGHSGGGSFIFGYVAAVDKIPPIVQRISFIDSNYGYDSTYYPKFNNWLKNNPQAVLTLMTYNDSVALYNGKPVVSATGGTWFRGWQMLRHLQNNFSFQYTDSDSLITYASKKPHIQFIFKKNFNRGIYHTQQVELNGLIHSVLLGTRYENKGYTYYGKRAYSEFIE